MPAARYLKHATHHDLCDVTVNPHGVYLFCMKIEDYCYETNSFAIVRLFWCFRDIQVNFYHLLF